MANAGRNAPRRRPRRSWAWLATVVVGTAPLSAAADAADAAPLYWVERRGQDTVVRRRSDDSIVYTTLVDDTSSGSDTDSDISGDEEFFHGCLWTFRQQLGMCHGKNCADVEIMAHDLQRRLLAFYADRQEKRPPPLEDAAWLLVGTQAEQRRELMESCPGLIVTVLLFMAEALVFTGPGQAEVYAREAESYAATLERYSPAQFETMLEMFPVREAFEGFQRERNSLEARAQFMAASPAAQPTVDIVVARCSSTLQWMWELDFPPRTRILVYDKCENSAETFQEQTRGLSGVVELEHRPMDEPGPGGFMTGECTAYLAHIVQALQSGTVADYTIFVHDDAPRHLRLALLSLALRGIISGAYDVPFLHLTHERYPAFRTRCLKEVHRRALGTELSGRLGTYCCAHFIVRRDRIDAHPVELYAHLLQLVSGAPYAKKNGGECNVGTKPCYVMEFLWHRIFGEEEELPTRAEHPGLPLALRYEGGRETRLETPLKVAPYMAMFQPTRYSQHLARLR